MIAPQSTHGKRACANRSAGSRSGTPNATHRRCVSHEFVNGIILLPNCRQAHAKLNCDTRSRCLGARSAIERRIPQPPSPPEFGTDRAQPLTRTTAANDGGRTRGRPFRPRRLWRDLIYLSSASAAPSSARGFSTVPPCTSTAAVSMPSPASACSGRLHALALPVQSPSLTQRRSTL